MCNSLNIIIKHHQHAQRPCASAPSAAETSSVRAGVFMCGSFPVGHGALRAERARAEGRLGRWREHALSGETKRKRAGEGKERELVRECSSRRARPATQKRGGGEVGCRGHAPAPGTQVRVVARACVQICNPRLGAGPSLLPRRAVESRCVVDRPPEGATERRGIMAGPFAERHRGGGWLAAGP